MAFRTASARALTCHCCRQHVLRSFIASIGIQAPTFGHTSQTNTLRARRRQERLYSTSQHQLSKEEEEAEYEEHALNEILEEVESNEAFKMRIATEARKAKEQEVEEEIEPLPLEAKVEAESLAMDEKRPPEQTTQQTTEHVPWYLQNQPPEPQQDHPFAHRQQLPELPVSPPSILQPLLEYVSKDLGMDDLSLLDLRALDPPPALGANLLMIIGTARSEKHLHVSADRLCRWLRSTHGMRPFADGLLGRNELKLKVRRKAKRSRLLSAVGAKDTGSGEVDDGIRTGWVCVNLGRVEDGELPEDVDKVQRAEGFVGFGARSQGANIVVQMMTEEKRGDVDLEKLWTGILNRAQREKNKEEKEEVDENAQTDTDTTIESQIAVTEASPEANGTTNYYPPSQTWNTGRLQQARALHTSARKLQEDILASVTQSHDNDASAESSLVATLERLVEGLKSMNHDAALKALSEGPIVPPRLTEVHFDVSGRHSSTPFLEAFYNQMPTWPKQEHWHMHIALLCHARERQLADTHTILGQLKAMDHACIVPLEKTYLLVLNALLNKSSDDRVAGHGVDIDYASPSPAHWASILKLLDSMESHGYHATSPEVLQMISDAVAAPRIINEPLPRTLEAASLVLLQSFQTAQLRQFALANKWPQFWRTWRLFPQRFLARTAAMYKILFESITRLAEENQRAAIDALRTCVPEMQQEEPPVALQGAVATAVLKALEGSEPRAKELGAGGSMGEWAVLWRKCRKEQQI